MVFVTRYLDLFYRWVSLYNSAMKLFFIASSCYILFLMKFKYRLEESVFSFMFVFVTLLSLLKQTNQRPLNRYLQNRVSRRTYHNPRPYLQLPIHLDGDPLVVFCLARGCCHSPSIIHAATHGWSRDHHHTLPCGPWRVQSALHSQLDIQVSPSLLQLHPKVWTRFEWHGRYMRHILLTPFFLVGISQRAS